MFIKKFVFATLQRNLQIHAYCSADVFNGILYIYQFYINKESMVSFSKHLTHIQLISLHCTLKPRQNGRHFADDIFKWIFLNENVWIPIKFSVKFVPQGPINNIPALVQIMAWCRPGDKPLSGPMMVRLPTHICVTRPQWVNWLTQVTTGDPGVCVLGMFITRVAMIRYRKKNQGQSLKQTG